MNKIKIEIKESEWLTIPQEMRTKIKSMLKDKYGYDISKIDEIDEDWELEDDE